MQDVTKVMQASDFPPPWNVMIPLAARLTVWVVLFAVLYVLRSFFLLIFLTFVFAYLQNFCVEKLKKWIRPRWPRVVLVGILLLAIVVAVFTYLFPQVRHQAEHFASQHEQYLQRVDSQLIDIASKYKSISYMFPQLENQGLSAGSEAANWDVRTSVSAKLFQQLIGAAKNSESADTPAVVQGIKSTVGTILATGSSFLLSLLFSFLIVLDLPRLTMGVRGLKDTKVGFIYAEIGQTLQNFAQVVGSALIAQLFIAILNTVLTAIGIFALGLGDKAAFLSILVFLCSFIPVAGVFISSAPICLLALEYGGIQLVVFSIMLIWIIHLVEAYILNPQIYGAHLRINPVLVLIILTIAGKLFGIWGLVLGLPVCTYIFGHAIRYGRIQSQNCQHVVSS